MKSRVLFDRVRSLWPDAIVLSAHDDESPIWSVVHTYEAIQQKIEGDDWLEIGAWSFHQALYQVARNRLALELKVVKPSEVSLAEFDKKIRGNLDDESWAKERQQYRPPEEEV